MQQTAEAAVALNNAAHACARIEDNQDLTEQRLIAWVLAKKAGNRYQDIAETCGISTQLVRLEVAWALDKPWAIRAKGGKHYDGPRPWEPASP